MSLATCPQGRAAQTEAGETGPFETNRSTGGK